MAGYCARHKMIKTDKEFNDCKNSDVLCEYLDIISGHPPEILDDNISHKPMLETPPPPQYPSTFRQIRNAAGATVNHVVDGMATVDDTEYNRRMDICKSCPLFIASEQRCSKCGCYLEVKARWRSSNCPDNPPRW